MQDLKLVFYIILFWFVNTISFESVILVQIMLQWDVIGRLQFDTNK